MALLQIKPNVSGMAITGSFSLTGLVNIVGAYGTNVILSGANTIAISGGGAGGGTTTNNNYYQVTSGVTGMSITGSVSLTGLVSIQGSGNVFTTLKGQTIIVSGDTGAYINFATTSNLELTGTALIGRDNTISGYFANNPSGYFNKVFYPTGVQVTGSVGLTGFINFVGAYGTNVILSGVNTIAISGGGAAVGGGSESSTASNLGGAVGVFSSLVGADLQFKSLSGLSGTRVMGNGNVIEITNPPRPSVNLTAANYLFDWTSGDSFYRDLHIDNWVIKFTGMQDGKNMVLGLSNTGNSFTGTWPPFVKWPNNVAPIQTPGYTTDIYTFVQINTGTFGTVVQGFPGKP